MATAELPSAALDANGSASYDTLTHGIASLLAVDDASFLIDFGFPELDASALPLCVDDRAEARVLAASLLEQRAAIALRLGRRQRALADAAAACALHPAAPRPVLRRAEALLAMGAWQQAEAALKPHVGATAACEPLLREARQRRARVTEFIASLVGRPNAGERLPDECAYIGCLRLQQQAGKGRGWVATAHIEPGELLMVELARFPLAAPDSAEHPLTLFEAIANELGSGGAKAESLRDLLSTMHPLPGVSGEALPTERDRVARAHVAQIGSRCGLSPPDATRYEKNVQRNMMSLKSRVAGELVDFGSGLFPISAIFNHSCHCNAIWQPISSGHAIVTRACRLIEPGEEVTVSYTELSRTGPKRREGLRHSHGFLCTCERCVAPPGSALYRLEALELALVCPHAPDAQAAGLDEKAAITFSTTHDIRPHHDACHQDACHAIPPHGHLLLPEHPYAEQPSYACVAPGCEGRLSADEASARVRDLIA